MKKLHSFCLFSTFCILTLLALSAAAQEKAPDVYASNPSEWRIANSIQGPGPRVPPVQEGGELKIVTGKRSAWAKLYPW